MRFSIRTTLLGGLATLAIVLGVSTFEAWEATESGRTTANAIFRDRVLPLRDLKAVADSYAVLVVDTAHKLRLGAVDWEPAGADLRRAMAEVERHWGIYRASRIAPEELRLVDAAEVARFAAGAATERLLGIVERRDAAALETFTRNELYQRIDPLSSRIGELIAVQVAGAESAYQDASRATDWFRTVAIALMLLGILSILAAVGVVIGRITRPIQGLTACMRRLAEGDMSASIPAQTRGDEVGEMARAVAVFKEQGLENQRLRAEQERERAVAEANKRSALEGMAERIEAETRTVVEGVQANTERMAATTVEMRNSAEAMRATSASVSEAAAQALANTTSVAASTEQLSASIREITARITQASDVSRRAVEGSSKAEEAINSLSEAIGRIGDVARMIGDVAGQTNLLALNATIEAARAGEAGKGFAVVASEVKNLAMQTARATEEITAKIGDITTVTARAVAAVQGIGTTIRDIDHMSTAIAAAAEQQSTATNEIARHVQDVANAARTVSDRIAITTEEAAGTSARADAMQQRAEEVRGAIGSLQGILVRVVRTSTAEVDRRREPRVSLSLPCQIEMQGRVSEARLADLSEHGAGVLADADLRVGSALVLVVAQHGLRIAATVVGARPGGYRLRLAVEAHHQAQAVRRIMALGAGAEDASAAVVPGRARPPAAPPSPPPRSVPAPLAA